MAVKLTRFDPANFLDDEADMLDDEADMVAHLADCAEDGDPALIAAALGAIARAKHERAGARSWNDSGGPIAGAIERRKPEFPDSLEGREGDRPQNLRYSGRPLSQGARGPRLTPRKTLPTGCMNLAGGDRRC